MKAQSIIACAGLCCAILTGCASTPAPAPETPSAPASETSAQQAAPVQNAETDAANAPAAAAAASEDDALRHAQDAADLMIYESWPEETTLDNKHIADVVPVWLDAIKSAQKTIDFSMFYAISEPGKALEPVIDALKDAVKRGVKVRFIVDGKMNNGENSILPKELAAIPGIELRVINYKEIAGGVQHAKYFIVDRKTAYFGSQNFDWRSLSQISEMGARLRPEALVNPLIDVFEIDWKLAGDPKAEYEKSQCAGAIDIDYKGEAMHIETVASPKSVLPCDAMWDLPKILDMINNAKETVSFQLLNYATTNYDKSKFTELDDALTAAAKRGVKVRMLVSDWSTKPKHMRDLKRLVQHENFEAKMITVPEHSDGFVPFSRTIHSKFLVVDADMTWLGTSNWAGDYFYESRNVGIVAQNKKLNAELKQSFDHYWNSEYAVTVDPNVDYPVKNQAKKE